MDYKHVFDMVLLFLIECNYFDMHLLVPFESFLTLSLVKMYSFISQIIMHKSL